MEYVIYYFVREDGSPFYIGKTKNFNQRKRRHLSNIKDQNNTLPKYHKARKLLSVGYSFDEIMIIQEKNLTAKQANQRETDLIKEHRDKGIKIYNLTDGGDGCSMTPEQQKIAAAKRTGQKRSVETRRKISKAKKGMKFSKKHKENLSKARRKRIIKEETKIKMSKSSKGKINIKKYKLVDPKGLEHITTNGLVDFCREHDLSSANLHKVLNGERKHHKGWKIERIKDDNF